MDPPGRFLKKCPNTGGWEELSLKEAATKTSQAMAYAVRESAKQKKELRSLRSKSNKGAASSQSAKKPPRLPSYVNVQHNASVSSSTAPASAAARSGRGGEVGTDVESSVSVSNEDDGNKLGGNNEISLSTIPAANPSLQQQLLQFQQQSSTASLPPANSGTPSNGLVQLLAQAQLQQRQEQNQQLLRQLLGQFPLGLQTQLPSTSLPSNLSLSSPSLSGLLLPNSNSDILRQASALPPQGNTLMNLLQQSSLLQNQAQTQSSPLSTQSLLGLMSMLQNQPQPAPTINPQLPWLSQQLNQAQQNQLNQVQQNQLLTALLTTSPNQTLLQQQSQPLNLLHQATLLQQQMAQAPSNYVSNLNLMTEANAASAAAKEKKGGDEEEN